MKPLRTLPVVALLLLGSAALCPSRGQEPFPAPAPPKADSLDDESAEPRRMNPELRRRFQDLLARRMADHLRLDEGQVDLVREELRRFAERQHELRAERQRLLAELRRSLEEAAETSRPRIGREREREREQESALAEHERSLRRSLEELRRNEEARQAALTEMRERLARELTIEQQARLQLFAEQFEQRMQEGARRIRERRDGFRRPPRWR